MTLYEQLTGRYLSPEPMLQDPRFVATMAQRGLAVPTYAYATNNPLKYADPTGLWVCNFSSETIYVKNENTSAVDPLPPGRCRSGDQDGFTIPKRFPKKVFKTVDHVNACVRDRGEPELSWWSEPQFDSVPPNDGMPFDIVGVGQWARGGWKGPDFANEHPDWKPLFNTSVP